MNLDDLHFKNRKYEPFKSYNQSKLANVLFVKSLADQYKDTNITAFSLHPGVINTNLTKPMGSGILINTIKTFFMDRDIPHGAATTLYAALSPDIENQSGAYLSDCQVTAPSQAGQDIDGKLRKGLWDVTKQQLIDAGAEF